jgi:hypothetical protein
MESELLDMLETLLALTEQFKDDMDGSERDLWSRISARTADIREGQDDESDPFDVETESDFG